jgi:aspartyl aminopeptidase
MKSDLINNLCEFLDKSVVNFLAVDTIAKTLVENGYTRLDPRQRWDLVPGGRYFVTQNSSAIFAFIVAKSLNANSFKIISAHSDSPGFRVKPNCEMLTEGNVLKLNTEVYGGPILYTWFDRPLSIAGRVILKSDDILAPKERVVRYDSPLMTIPHLAIHFNRAVNEGNRLSKQKDMLPVVGRFDNVADAKDWLKHFIAEKFDINFDDILDYDISLYDTTKAQVLGANQEFITSGRLDDLSMAHAAMSALLGADGESTSTRVMAIFDNEETGSGTKQGAASPILDYVLRRINQSLGGDEQDYMAAVARSFMVSADNAHGLHPNYVEKQDPTNHPLLGSGPVIKINANCKYMSDAESAAIFASICERAGVPYQYFVNHSDVAGGSTLGNILTSQIPLRGVDMGAAIWAMHSARETASVADHEYITRAFTTFYNI